MTRRGLMRAAVPWVIAASALALAAVGGSLLGARGLRAEHAVPLVVAVALVWVRHAWRAVAERRRRQPSPPAAPAAVAPPIAPPPAAPPPAAGPVVAPAVRVPRVRLAPTPAPPLALEDKVEKEIPPPPDHPFPFGTASDWLPPPPAPVLEDNVEKENPGAPGWPADDSSSWSPADAEARALRLLDGEPVPREPDPQPQAAVREPGAETAGDQTAVSPDTAALAGPIEVVEADAADGADGCVGPAAEWPRLDDVLAAMAGPQRPVPAFERRRVVDWVVRP